uniref:MICOS complex subunit n=1 Tax=Panagrolaimus superbus TaxID=310955 RepID=A0A914YXA2_9BILA
MSTDTEPLVTKIKNFGKSVFTLATAEKRSAELPPQLVAIKDLPIYNEKDKSIDYKFVEKEKLPLEHEFTTIRYAILDSYELFAQRFAIVDKALTKTKNAVVATDDYIRNEWTVLPKAAAITIGGMAGFVLGLRRYGIRKFIYSAGGLGTMAAFCYPNETVDIVRTGVAHAKRTYEDFKKSP